MRVQAELPVSVQGMGEWMVARVWFALAISSQPISKTSSVRPASTALRPIHTSKFGWLDPNARAFWRASNRSNGSEVTRPSSVQRSALLGRSVIAARRISVDRDGSSFATSAAWPMASSGSVVCWSRSCSHSASIALKASASSMGSTCTVGERAADERGKREMKFRISSRRRGCLPSSLPQNSRSNLDCRHSESGCSRASRSNAWISTGSGSSGLSLTTLLYGRVSARATLLNPVALEFH